MEHDAVEEEENSEGDDDNEDEAGEGEYDCEEDGVVYMHRKAPVGYKQKKTETWQECQELCAEMEPCKGFTWHKPHNTFGSPRNSCSLYSTHVGRKKKDSTVSGRKECFKKH